MSFLHPALLAMAAFASLPVIIHLAMRPRPKRLLFPALRLIESRRRSNVRRMRLRHIWLMLLRIAVIVLLVIAVARPLVPAAHYGLTSLEMGLLAGIAASCLAAYFAAIRWWARPAGRSEFLYRRAALRGGTGLLAGLLVLLLVVWPYARRISAEVTNPNEAGPREDQPVAAVFLFDTSRSMEYKLDGQTRLDKAKAIALTYLAELPRGSRVAVMTAAADEPPVFQADLAGAEERIKSLEPASLAYPLESRVRRAFELQGRDRESVVGKQTMRPKAQRRDQFARGVYLFTDLAASAWTGTKIKTLAARLGNQPWLQMFLVDVGVDEPRNVGITAAKPSVEIAAGNGPTFLKTEVMALGAGGEASVELFLEKNSDLVKIGQSQATMAPGQTIPLTFPLVMGDAGFIQGQVRLLAGDPYAPDDVRYFTVAVQPLPAVLVISDETIDGRLLAEVLRARGYEVTQRQTERIGTEKLDAYDVICLVNVTTPAKRLWQRLEKFVRGGSGLAIVLGTHVDPLAYGSEEAAAVLPAKLLAPLSFQPPAFFHPLDDGHPIFAQFAEFGGYGWLTKRDVRRHYVVEPDSGVAVIAEYTYDKERREALLVDSLGAGRVALLTTGLDNTKSWSDLPLADWTFMALADQMTLFLAGRSEGRRNFLVGQTGTIRFGGNDAPEKFLLRTPTLDQRLINLPAGADRVVLDALNEIGSYVLVAGSEGPAFQAGLSVNLPPSESDFTKLRQGELDQLFGAERYQLADTAEELAIVVRDATLGAELMPYVVIVLVMVFFGEQFVSNRFYDRDPADEA